MNAFVPLLKLAVPRINPDLRLMLKRRVEPAIALGAEMVLKTPFSSTKDVVNPFAFAVHPVIRPALLMPIKSVFVLFG